MYTPSGVELTMVPLTPCLLEGFLRRGLGGCYTGLDVALWDDPPAGIARGQQQNLNFAAPDAVSDDTCLKKRLVPFYHRLGRDKMGQASLQFETISGPAHRADNVRLALVSNGLAQTPHIDVYCLRLHGTICTPDPIKYLLAREDAVGEMHQQL
jgi:hypothetical protein